MGPYLCLHTDRKAGHWSGASLWDVSTVQALCSNARMQTSQGGARRLRCQHWRCLQPTTSSSGQWPQSPTCSIDPVVRQLQQHHFLPPLM